MANQIAIFNPLEIKAGDGEISLIQGGQVVDLSYDQLPDVIRALRSISAEHEANNARRAIQAMRDDLTGKKPASVRPIPNGNGPEAA